jgi:hypothetical protein
MDAGAVRVIPRGSSVDANGLLSSPRVRDGWFYPPLEPEFLSANDLGYKHISFAPWFSLPQTHALVLTQDTNEELATFLILTLGLLKGLQLVPEGWGHFYRTPIEPGKLVDFSPRRAACERIMARAYEYWLETPAIRTWILGAIHWHLFGPTYEHPFEQFGVAYSVLDTCWRIHRETSPVARHMPHAERIVHLCDYYDLTAPPWAKLTGKSSSLSTLRNEYFHESLWGGQPIGFAQPVNIPDIHLELFWFNTRLLLAILGERCSYTCSAITYQTQRLA